MKKLKGSILLEVIISMVLMSAITIAGQDMVSQAINANTVLSNKVAQSEEQNRVWMLIQSDVRQIVNRPVRNASGISESAMVVSSSQLMATKAGWNNAMHTDSSRLQRFQYQLVGGVLARTSWNELDGAEAKDSQVLRFNNVKTFGVQVLNDDNTWTSTITNVTKETMPMAIKITLQMSGGDSFTRIFDLPFYELPTKPKQITTN